MERETWEGMLVGTIAVVGVLLLILIALFLLAGSVLRSDDLSPTSLVRRMGDLYNEIEVLVLLGVIITTAYVLAKRSLVGEERVMVHRELTKEGDELKITYQVLNKSTFPLRNATLEVRTPPDVEVVQGSNTVDVGDIETDEARNVVVTVRPKHFTSGTVTAVVSYYHRRWCQVPVQAVGLGSIYPFIEPVGTAEAEGIYAGVGGMYSERDVFRFEIDPQTMFNAVVGRLQTATPVHLYAAISQGLFQGFGAWVGRDPQSKSVVCVIAQTKDYPGIKGGEVELMVCSTEEALTSRYVGELHRTLHVREEAPVRRDYLRTLAGRISSYGRALGEGRPPE